MHGLLEIKAKSPRIFRRLTFVSWIAQFAKEYYAAMAMAMAMAMVWVKSSLASQGVR